LEKNEKQMTKHGLLTTFASLLIFLGFILSACSQAEILPDPETVSGVYVQAGTEFGLSDPTILEFIQSSSEIDARLFDCISATTTEDDSNVPDAESAQQTLVSFFVYLHAGEYKRAVDFYVGVYSSLQDLNPNVDPNDHAALFKNVCTVNGAQCLEVRQSTLLDQLSPAEFRFSVEFSNEDGSLYSRGPCCGDDSVKNDVQTEFIYTVRFACTGDYKVLELPVFNP
jgi:hypothetical protein